MLGGTAVGIVDEVDAGGVGARAKQPFNQEVLSTTCGMTGQGRQRPTDLLAVHTDSELRVPAPRILTDL